MPRVTGLKHKYIGKTIRKWLIDADMNQSDLAEKLGVNRQKISYKIQNNAITYEDLLNIIEALGVPDEEILAVMKK